MQVHPQYVRKSSAGLMITLQFEVLFIPQPPHAGTFGGVTKDWDAMEWCWLVKTVQEPVGENPWKPPRLEGN